MQIKQIIEKDKETFNKAVFHPLQSYEWGEFREKAGLKTIRRGIFNDGELVGGFQLTIHPIPHTPWNIGYLPKGEVPDMETLEELVRIGKEERCIFIQLEPNIKIQDSRHKAEELIQSSEFRVQSSAHPLFTKYTFILDLTKSEDELLKNMHPKTRYNIKVAKKHGVKVIEDDSMSAFDSYCELTSETTKRQNFYAHSERYHRLQWEIFPHKIEKNALSSHLFTARFQGRILTTMLFFVFKDIMYYPYGASSNDYRNVMHSTLTMWEAICWGKRHGLKSFDMWGALGPSPNPNDSWYGFHMFKQRFGPDYTEFAGSYDLILNPLLYRFYVISDKIRWLYLKSKR